jgi:hypothetical protein
VLELPAFAEYCGGSSEPLFAFKHWVNKSAGASSTAPAPRRNCIAFTIEM